MDIQLLDTTSWRERFFWKQSLSVYAWRYESSCVFSSEADNIRET